MASRMELGSEFDLGTDQLNTSARSFQTMMTGYSYALYDYGRSAIRAVAGMLTGRKVLLPEYICESVITCFDPEMIVFYHIDRTLCIDFEDLRAKLAQDVGAVYICHYFGRLQDRISLHALYEELQERNILMLEDVTQSLFSCMEEATGGYIYPPVGDYAIASIRKWMAIPQGAVLYSNRELADDFTPAMRSTDNARISAMVLKNLYLNSEYDTNEMYRAIFVACEEQVDELRDISGISEPAEYLMNCVDIAELVSRRKRNAAYVAEAMKQLGIEVMCDYKEGECPLVLPIRIPNRDGFRKYLIDHRIYCAVHWPFDGIRPEDRVQAALFGQTLLSLPIDQRYGTQELDYMIEIISSYGGQLTF